MSELELRTERRDPARSDARLIAWSVFVGIFVLLAFAGQFLGEERRAEELAPVYTWEFAVAAAVSFGLILLATFLIAIDAPKRDLLALRAPESWGYAAALSIGVFFGILLVAGFLSWLLGAGDEQGLAPKGWNADRAPQFAAAVVAVGVLAPLAEELLFRGLGFTLLERFGRVTAILLTAAVFGLAHGLIRGFLPLAAFGLGVAFLRDQTKSVYPGMIVHGVFNTSQLALAVTVGERAEALGLLTLLCP